MSQNDNPFGALKSLVEKGQIQTKAYVPAANGKKPSAAALRYADASVKKAFEESLKAEQSKKNEEPKPTPRTKLQIKPETPQKAQPEHRTAPAPRKVLRSDENTAVSRRSPKAQKQPTEAGKSAFERLPQKSVRAAPSRTVRTRSVRAATPKEAADPNAGRRELMPVAQQHRSAFVPPNPITRPVTLVQGLPVSEHAEELIEAVRNNPVIVVCGETGSGKTTQLPKICLLAGRGVKGLIGHTQPRRIAASSIAKRIAAELESEVGEIVGYKVRFTDKTMPGAAIKLMTDGILLAETQTDPLLKRYDTIIIDEAHERSINIDFLLGYLKRVLQKRKDLKVIITSATIDAERFAKHFEIDGKPSPVFTISGRTYPVQIRWRPVDDTDETDDKTLMDAVADACDELQIA